MSDIKDDIHFLLRVIELKGCCSIVIRERDLSCNFCSALIVSALTCPVHCEYLSMMPSDAVLLKALEALKDICESNPELALERLL